VEGFSLGGDWGLAGRGLAPETSNNRIARKNRCKRHLDEPMECYHCSFGRNRRGRYALLSSQRKSGLEGVSSGAEAQFDLIQCARAEPRPPGVNDFLRAKRRALLGGICFLLLVRQYEIYLYRDFYFDSLPIQKQRLVFPLRDRINRGLDQEWMTFCDLNFLHRAVARDHASQSYFARDVRLVS